MPAPALTACRPARRHAALMKHGEYLPEADKGPEAVPDCRGRPPEQVEMVGFASARWM
ncbi:hypothetical protein GCM10018790_30720 [Kitasatospora xanthocidica]|nr:hypothetical protein GCM10018790_30720 [Kitasatospora xanthocidica]